MGKRWLMTSAWGRRYVFDRETRQILDAYRARATSPLDWQPISPSPMPRYDASAVQIRERFYVIGGYLDLDHVTSCIDVLDLPTCRWVARWDMPAAMAHHHHGVATDGERFAYFVAGQYGPRCSPAVATGYSLDVTTGEWLPLPPLPEPRYAPALRLWRGRLHALGGAQPDRITPATEHWSIAVDAGRAHDNAWRNEIPAPRGGGHRSSAVVGDRLYLLGGQEGDFKPIPGDPLFTCSHETLETVYGDCYLLEPNAQQWQRLPDMPIPTSHTESSVIVLGEQVLLLGGYIHQDPRTYAMTLTDVIQRFDTRSRTWTLVGRLPYRVKTTLAAYHGGWMYAMTGQRDLDEDDPSPGAIEARAWRARYTT